MSNQSGNRAHESTEHDRNQNGSGLNITENTKQRDMQGDMQNATDDPSRWRELEGEEIADSTDTQHDKSREMVKQANQDQ
jgi:hypothetical protein